MSEKYIRVSDIKYVCCPYHDYGVPQFTAEEIAKSLLGKARLELLRRIASAYFGKGYYFPDEGGKVYSRYAGRDMTLDEAIDEFVRVVGSYEVEE